MAVRNQFAAAGSCSAPEKIIKGVVNGTTFTSEEFTGSMDSQIFWDDLSAYAKSINAFVVLVDDKNYKLPTIKNSLDDVINSCEEMSKESKNRDSKEKNIIDKDDR